MKKQFKAVIETVYTVDTSHEDFDADKFQKTSVEDFIHYLLHESGLNGKSKTEEISSRAISHSGGWEDVK